MDGEERKPNTTKKKKNKRSKKQKAKQTDKVSIGVDSSNPNLSGIDRAVSDDSLLRQKNGSSDLLGPTKSMSAIHGGRGAEKSAAADVITRKSDRKEISSSKTHKNSFCFGASDILGASSNTATVNNGSTVTSSNNGNSNTSKGGGRKDRKRRRQEAAASLAAAHAVQTATTAAHPAPLSSKKARTSSTTTNEATTSEVRDKGGRRSNSKKNKNKNGSTHNSKGGGSSPTSSSPTSSSPSASVGLSSSRKNSGAAVGGNGAATGLLAVPRLSELQKRMRQKLEGAQFRMINETLYTSESGASLAKFKEEPELFDVVRGRQGEEVTEKERGGGGRERSR